MRHALVVLALLAAGCASEPKATEDKEIFIEPFREPEYELARIGRVVPFPIAPAEQPRAFSFARAFVGEDERFARTQMLVAGTDEKEAPDPRKLEKPPTSLVFPDRVDVREGSACYLAHCCFLAHMGTQIVHHLRLLVVNREKARVRVAVSSFAVLADPSGDGKSSAPLALLAAATDRAVKIPAYMEVPPGEQRTAHFFYTEKGRISPLLQVSWTAAVDDLHGGPEREVAFRGDLIRRYVAREAPLSPLEDRIARGLIDLPEPIGTASDWIDPGLSAVPGVGR